jgi:hypothetical protein
MKRIVWEPDQKLAVAKRSFQLVNDPLFIGTPITAVRTAMAEIIPPEDQRTLGNMEVVNKWLKPIWDELKTHSPQAKAINPIVDHRAEFEYQQKRMLLSELTTEDLLSEFMKRVTDLTSERRIKSLVQEQVQLELERSIPGWKPQILIEEPETIEARNKPHVLILGLEEGQKQIIVSKYKGLLDLHFKSGSEGAKTVKSLVDNMDLTIKTKWCKGHLGSTKGWPNFMNSNGGVSEIQRQINLRFKLQGEQQ